jgi:chemotaxis protein CheX
MKDIYKTAVMQVLGGSGFTEFSIEADADCCSVSDVISTIGLTGDLKGYFMLRADLESARSFATLMAQNLGIPQEEDGPGPLGRLRKEAIGEISNQIAGRAIMLLSELGYDCNITPPTIITGENVYTDMVNFEKILRYLISGPFGKMTVFVGLKNGKNQ